MRIQSLLPNLKTWFDEYTRRFSSDDPVVQDAMDLKVEHTRRVCEAIVGIGSGLSLSSEDQCIAEASALLHDIGRFDQYRRYRTFSDDKSENHALLGAKVIQSNRILQDLEGEITELIVFLVRSHNLLDLPSEAPARSLLFLKLLRDADKLDIWRVVTDYYHNHKHNRSEAVELDLPDTPEVSEPVYETLMSGRLVRMTDLKTLTDFKLLQLGWVYDLNFPVTFRLVLEKGYLERILDALPQDSDRVKKIYEQARAYTERHALSESS